MPKTFTQIPLTRPDTPLLDTLSSPADLRQLPASQLERVVDELREYLLYAVGQCGGHFGAGLGVVELTVALHYLYHTPDDKLVWDVGHQCYPHKILTGRRESLTSIRQAGGLSGFPSAANPNTTPSAWATRPPPSAPRWAWRWARKWPAVTAVPWPLSVMAP